MTVEQRAGVERLLAWEDRFAEDAPAPGAWVEQPARDGKLPLAYVRYAPEIDEFFAAVHEEFAEGDYLERMRALGGLGHPPEWFARADYEALRTVLFTISRGERFSDGLRLDQCVNGTVRRALARLRELLTAPEGV